MIPFFLGILGVICVLTFYYFKNLNTRTVPLDAPVRLELDGETVDAIVPSCVPSKYTAVIIEPRNHRALAFVLKNYAENLSEDWNFILIHSTENEKYVKAIFAGEMKKYKHRYSFVQLRISKMTIKDYNCIFYNESFYDLIPTETFLIFQTDSMILSENKDNINDFLKYDYVGAPWPHTMGDLGYMKVGNGGLSLRKKSKMLELLKYKHYGIDTNLRQTYGKYIAEDQFFCGFYVKEVKLFKPYWEKAKNFSVEAVFCEKPFGIHACWKQLSNKETNILIKLYPDIDKLKDFN
jgi:hypothetical protein